MKMLNQYIGFIRIVTYPGESAEHRMSRMALTAVLAGGLPTAMASVSVGLGPTTMVIVGLYIFIALALAALMRSPKSLGEIGPLVLMAVAPAGLVVNRFVGGADNLVAICLCATLAVIAGMSLGWGFGTGAGLAGVAAVVAEYTAVSVQRGVIEDSILGVWLAALSALGGSALMLTSAFITGTRMPAARQVHAGDSKRRLLRGGATVRRMPRIAWCAISCVRAAAGPAKRARRA